MVLSAFIFVFAPLLLETFNEVGFDRGMQFVNERFVQAVGADQIDHVREILKSAR